MNKIASHNERSECSTLSRLIADGHVLLHLCMASLRLRLPPRNRFRFLFSRSVSRLSNVNACAWWGSRRYAMWQNLKEMYRMSCNFQTTDSADSDEWMWKWTNGAALHLQTKKRTMKQLPYHVITPFHLSFWNIFQNTRSRMGSDNNYYFELRPGINGKNSSFHFFFSGSSFPRRYLITSLVVDSSMTRAYACMQRTGKSSNGRHMLLLLWLRCQRV